MAPLQGADHICALSGGLRLATTTGYYLTALQDEIRSLRFNTALGVGQPITRNIRQRKWF